MTISAETTAYLDAVERFAQRVFTYRREIEILLELSNTGPGRSMFDELIFHAKFVTNASAVLKRTGGQTEETKNLSGELRDGLERVGDLIRTIIGSAPDDVRQEFYRDFFSTTGHLAALLHELSWVKNYTIDRQSR